MANLGLLGAAKGLGQGLSEAGQTMQKEELRKRRAERREAAKKRLQNRQWERQDEVRSEKWDRQDVIREQERQQALADYERQQQDKRELARAKQDMALDTYRGKREIDQQFAEPEAGWQLVQHPELGYVQQNTSTGEIKPVEGGAGNRFSGVGGDDLPAKAQLTEYLVANGIAKDRSEAWQKVQSGVDNPQEFIREHVANRMQRQEEALVPPENPVTPQEAAQEAVQILQAGEQALMQGGGDGGGGGAAGVSGAPGGSGQGAPGPQGGSGGLTLSDVRSMDVQGLASQVQRMSVEELDQLPADVRREMHRRLQQGRQ